MTYALRDNRQNIINMTKRS